MGQKLLIKNIAELVTCRGTIPKAGTDMNELGIIKDGAIVSENGQIISVGPANEVLNGFEEEGCQIIDASGKCVLPGFIDAHTHFVFGGYRPEEFSWRLAGDSYAEIMKRGGGIVNTVRATRQTSYEELKSLAKKRLDTMLTMGVTTVEGKSGYGLDSETELKQLKVMAELNAEHPVDIVATFMGAHAIPEEYKGRADDYVDYMITEVLPQVVEQGFAQFCDVFCEKDVFSLKQSERLLIAARVMGLKAKLHADEIYPLGGAELAGKIGATSADHLLQATDAGIHAMVKRKVVATLLPITAFSLKETYARARFLIDHGTPVALATDFNPGSCFSQSIPLVIALAALYMQMTPAEIVTGLTANAAAAIDRADKIGSLEAGKQADIIILEYPSHLYLPYHVGMNIVKTVIKNGEIVFAK
jgi:imidazolonepropionase